MKLFKDTTNQIAFNRSTFFFEIAKTDFQADAKTYIERMISQLRFSGKYDKIDYYNADNKYSGLQYIKAVGKKQGLDNAVLFYLPIPKVHANPG